MGDYSGALTRSWFPRHIVSKRRLIAILFSDNMLRPLCSHKDLLVVALCAFIKLLIINFKEKKKPLYGGVYWSFLFTSAKSIFPSGV